MDKICTTPFKKLEIAWDGKVYTCCPSFIKYNYIGNILDENVVSLDDIWNSEKAQIIRKNILENNYSMCDLEICREKYLDEKYEELAIWKTTNPLHNDFLKIIKNVKEIDYYKCIIPPIFQKL